MIFGFTGTKKGMTQRQRATVRYLFCELQLTELHHGDCEGADRQAHNLAWLLNAHLVIHLPSDEKLRAFCAGAHEIRPALPYLKRNGNIVEEGLDGLIAAPKDFIEPSCLRGQGTWTTIGYARKMGRRIWIVRPDGTI